VSKAFGQKMEPPMSRLHVHPESHLVSRIGWLRAAVLGANDGIVSTASLIVGVASASAGTPEIVVAGVAGLVAGAMSMAAGEYVSVSSQSDTEQADLARERAELKLQPEFERKELARRQPGAGVSGSGPVDGQGCAWSPCAR
jgi:VIT1/CCC1 family predicted Fe2+/Mn2+ transporter